VHGACTGPDAQRSAAEAPYVATDSMGITVEARSIPVRARPELVENSGTAMSVAQPGIVFTFNDSGNDPLLFALDTMGTDRGVWRIAGARNEDWEAASMGPCGADSAALAVPRCVYLGDVGDNEAERSTRVLYRVAEPPVGPTGTTGVLTAEKLTYRYEDHPHDVEAIYVGPKGDLYIITKRPLSAGNDRLRPALVYLVPAASWASGVVTVARLVDSLPIIPGSAPLRQITDAALSPDSRWLAVRTYAQVFVFAADTMSGRVATTTSPTVCNVIGLLERQGEGIGWLGTSGRLLLTSEGNDEPFRVIDCPRPSP
jgi:hypothetical protein